MIHIAKGKIWRGSVATLCRIFTAADRAVRGGHADCPVCLGIYAGIVAGRKS